jgi:hypothetical protein
MEVDELIVASIVDEISRLLRKYIDHFILSEMHFSGPSFNSVHVVINTYLGTILILSSNLHQSFKNMFPIIHSSSTPRVLHILFVSCCFNEL